MRIRNAILLVLIALSYFACKNDFKPKTTRDALDRWHINKLKARVTYLDSVYFKELKDIDVKKTEQLNDSIYFDDNKDSTLSCDYNFSWRNPRLYFRFDFTNNIYNLYKELNKPKFVGLESTLNIETDNGFMNYPEFKNKYYYNIEAWLFSDAQCNYNRVDVDGDYDSVPTEIYYSYDFNKFDFENDKIIMLRTLKKGKDDKDWYEPVVKIYKTKQEMDSELITLHIKPPPDIEAWSKEYDRTHPKPVKPKEKEKSWLEKFIAKFQ